MHVRDNCVRISFFMLPWWKLKIRGLATIFSEHLMASTCQTCVGPIDLPDEHEFYVACLGLAHAEAVFTDSTCAHCAKLPGRTLRTRRDMVCAITGTRPAPAWRRR